MGRRRRIHCLVVILHQLDDYTDVIAVVLDGDHSHDIGRVFCVWILAVFVGQDQTRVSFMDFSPLQVSDTHETSLEIFHSCMLSLEKSFKLEVRFCSVEEHNLYIHVISVLVEEVLQEHGDRFKGDVTAHHYVPNMRQLCNV